jgi:hypothetical protein
MLTDPIRFKNIFDLLDQAHELDNDYFMNQDKWTDYDRESIIKMKS